jgi:hypothetical protein
MMAGYADFKSEGVVLPVPSGGAFDAEAQHARRRR